MDMRCKLKNRCPNQAADLLNCWSPDCSGWVHEGCCKLLLDKHNIPVVERPTTDDKETSESEPVVFCTKACYLKWKAEKKRKLKEAAAVAVAAARKKRKVPWETDGSMEVLLEWMTTQGNYATYCGANGHQNKGKSKTAIHKDIALLIKQKKPESERDAKDVENKIGSLERQFREANDWANNTGQGVTDPGDFEAAIKKRCLYFHELEDIMGERPNAKPLGTNEDSDLDLDLDVFGEEEEPEAATALEESTARTVATTPLAVRTNPPTMEALSSVSSKSTSAPKRRLSASSSKGNRNPSKAKGKDSVDEIVSSYFQDASFQSMREREVQAREKEANARMLEAEATSAKAAKETQILDIQAKSALLRERKKLLDEGVCTQDELDEFMPLK